MHAYADTHVHTQNGRMRGGFPEKGHLFKELPEEHILGTEGEKDVPGR